MSNIKNSKEERTIILEEIVFCGVLLLLMFLAFFMHYNDATERTSKLNERVIEIEKTLEQEKTHIMEKN